MTCPSSLVFYICHDGNNFQNVIYLQGNFLLLFSKGDICYFVINCLYCCLVYNKGFNNNFLAIPQILRRSKRMSRKNRWTELSYWQKKIKYTSVEGWRKNYIKTWEEFFWNEKKGFSEKLDRLNKSNPLRYMVNDSKNKKSNFTVFWPDLLGSWQWASRRYTIATFFTE